MKRRLLATLYLTMGLALAACGDEEPAPAPPAAETPAEAAPAATAAAPTPAGCVTQAGKDWMIGEDSYRLEAAASGPECRYAVATLVLRRPDGRAIHAVAYPISAIPLAFRPRPDQEQLAEELAGWLNDQSGFFTADALPAWPQGADKPAQFAPAASREAYEAAQTAKRPVFCYPDGGESNACVAVDPRTRAAVLLGSYTPERD